MVNTERLYLECSCSCAQHTLRFSRANWDDDFDKFLVVAMYLGQYRGFFRRLWYAIKYVCGIKSPYGAFGETLLEPQQVIELRDLCNRHLQFLNDAKEGREKLTYEQVLEKIKGFNMKEIEVDLNAELNEMKRKGE